MPNHKSEDYKLWAVDYYLTDGKTQKEVCKIELDINNYNKIYMKNLIVNPHHLSFNNNFIVFDKLV